MKGVGGVVAEFGLFCGGHFFFPAEGAVELRRLGREPVGLEPLFAGYEDASGEGVARAALLESGLE